MDGEDTVILLPEVQQEVEVTSMNFTPEDEGERTFTDLDTHTSATIELSDYGRFNQPHLYKL